jgi:transposase-like protein
VTEGALPTAGERAVPFYCPYCGDEDLRPYDENAGSWRCGSCTRAFTLKTVKQN